MYKKREKKNKKNVCMLENMWPQTAWICDHNIQKKIKNKKYGNKVKDLVGAPIDGYTRNCHGLKAVTIC